MVEQYSISIDCPPGNPRPGDLLPGVLEGTGVTLDAAHPERMLFGHWEWVIPEAQREAYEKARPLIKERITRLYNGGLIRYGGW